jgi:hypothetical protein
MCTRTLKNSTTKLNTELAYAAAFIDGEGYIEYTRRPKKNGLGKVYNTICIRIEVCNTDHGIIRWLRDTFKQGYLVKIKPRKTKTGMSRPVLRWQLTHNKVYEVLKQVFPYMKEKNKKEKARKILEFYENK